jgi:LAO/AO transport system kinase
VRRRAPAAELVAQARTGDDRAVARLISLVEAGEEGLAEVAALLADRPRRARVLGFTGPPGVGKSSLVSAVTRELRSRGRSVGVLAVDPSSSYSGGALLGDRVRMQEHALDRGVFVRSMASRGQLGGLAVATPQAVRVLELAGCDVVLVETVGVGQNEVDVAGLADTNLVVLAPGMGDAVQAAKAGVLETGDLYVVNKADHEAAERLRRELRTMVSMAPRADGGWRPPVVLTVAPDGTGVGELVDAVDAHATWAAQHAAGAGTARARAEVEALALFLVRRHLAGLGLDEPTLRAVAGDQLSAYDAARRLLVAAAGEPSALR